MIEMRRKAEGYLKRAEQVKKLVKAGEGTFLHTIPIRCVNSVLTLRTIIPFIQTCERRFSQSLSMKELQVTAMSRCSVNT